MNSYDLMIGGSLIVVLSYSYNHIAKRFKIPSVILLILTGFFIAFFGNIVETFFSQQVLKTALPVLGGIGLVLIVLEAALDLKIKQENRALMIRAFWAALIILVVTIFLSAACLSFLAGLTVQESIIYAIPISVMSSAIIIPSVANLTHHTKEFMIYESTFSDILGVMFFLMMLGMSEADSPVGMVGVVFRDLIITLIATVVCGYLMIFIFQRLHKSIGLFFLLSLLIGIYAAGKKFHVSSLLIIFFFGLIINNMNVFFTGKMSRYVNYDIFEEMDEKFKSVVEESAFLIRTFFFVLFGMSINILGLVDWRVWSITMVLLGILYGVRYIGLKGVRRKSSVTPELYIAPRGLITILLIDSIPVNLQNEAFNEYKNGVILLLILVTCLIMMFPLLTHRGEDKHALKPKEIGSGDDFSGTDDVEFSESEEVA